MTLLSPLALALALVAVPILLMYVLKLRRQEHVVSSTLLWRRVLDDVQANAPWQRLRPSVLLLLQLLAVLALVLALARPAYTRARSFDGDLIVILDQSYGMQVRDHSAPGNPTRFSEALDRARALARDVGGGNVMSVIGMESEPHLVLAGSDDRQAIDSALGRLSPGIEPPSFLPALSLAASLARSGTRTRLVVLTSRDSGISSLPMEVPFGVQIVRLGGPLRDLGITAFQARRLGQHTAVFLRVDNFGPQSASSDLDLYADGSPGQAGLQLADVRPINVPPGRQTSIFWNDLPDTIHRLYAHLTVRDDMSADKSAWAIPPGGAARRVLLVTNGDYFLQTALAVDPSITVSTIFPDEYGQASLSQAAASTRAFDLVVFENTLPHALPSVPILLVGPPSGRIAGISFGRERLVGSLRQAGLSISTGPASNSSPGTLWASLLRYVDLSDVHVAQSRDMVRPPWLEPLVTAGSMPLIAAGDGPVGRLAVIAFNPQESDWPLRISFPVLMQNLVRYLVPSTILGAADIRTGQPVALSPHPGTRELQITRPDGSIDLVRPPFPPYTATTEPGVYTVMAIGTLGRQQSQTGGAAESFVANIFPARTAPAGGPAVLQYGFTASGSARAVGVPVSLAWAFGLIALVILTAEWWYAYRR